MNIKSSITNLFYLYFATLLSLFAGIGVSVYNARLLGVDGFGDFKFIQLVYGTIPVFIFFGLNNSLARILTVNEKNEKSFFGTYLIVSLAISLIGLLGIYLFSIFNDFYFKDNLGFVFRNFSFFIIPLIFLIGLKNILQGSGKIKLLSLTQTGPQLCYLLLVFIIGELTMSSAIILHYSSILIVVVGIIIFLNPSFKNIKTNLELVFKENQTYGKFTYYASIASIGTAQLGGIILGYFLENKIVGFFLLSVTICQPLVMIPSILGTTFFKQFAREYRIPKKILIYTFIVCCFSYILMFIFIEPIISFFYTTDFIEVARYAKLIAFGAILHGFGDIFNRFLGAHSKGKPLRDGAFVVGFVNIFGYISLIYFFGIDGALITRILSGVAYFIMMYLAYNRHIK